MMILGRRHSEHLLAGIGLLALLAVAFTSMDWQAGSIPNDAAQKVRQATRSWSVVPALTAQKMMDKYGAPDQISTDQLVWMRRGDWLKIVVRADGAMQPSGGIVEQSVRYDNPTARWWDVQNLWIGARYEPVGQVLTAASATEEANYLAVNVAVDVMEGRKSVPDGREFYRRTLDLAMSGKSSPYTRGLLFKTADRAPARLPGQIYPLP